MTGETASRARGSAEVGDGLKDRALAEMRKYAVIAAYLWVLFFLFGLYRRQLLQEQGVNVWRQSFAIVNALVFGKVILLGQALKIGRGLETRPLAWVVLGKALIFAVLLIAFHVAEEAIRAWFEGDALFSGAAPGDLAALLTFAAIFFVALIPFFAFQEAARVLGAPTLRTLFFGARKQFRLVDEDAAAGSNGPTR